MYSNPSNSDWSILLMTSLRRVTQEEELEVLFSHKQQTWVNFRMSVLFLFLNVIGINTDNDAVHCPMNYCDGHSEFEKGEPFTMKWIVEKQQEVRGGKGIVECQSPRLTFCSLTPELPKLLWRICLVHSETYSCKVS